MNLPKVRICSKCKVEKCLEEFPTREDGKYGRTSWCRECFNQYMVKRYQTDLEYRGKFDERCSKRMLERCKNEPGYREKRKRNDKKNRLKAKGRFFNGGWKTAEVAREISDSRGRYMVHFKGYGGFNMSRSRWVMMNKVGRPLESWEVVHHKDRNGTNDTVENLELLPKIYHDETMHFKTIITNLVKENKKLKEELLRYKEKFRKIL